MPTHYQYQCSACGTVETRYRNAQRSRCCHAEMTRLEGKPIDWEGHVANLQAEVDRLRAQNSNLHLATDAMIAENRLLRAEAVVVDDLRRENERLRTALEAIENFGAESDGKTDLTVRMFYVSHRALQGDNDVQDQP